MTARPPKKKARRWSKKRRAAFEAKKARRARVAAQKKRTRAARRKLKVVRKAAGLSPQGRSVAKRFKALAKAQAAKRRQLKRKRGRSVLPEQARWNVKHEAAPNSHPDGRFFASGSQFLGYLEGRPGVRTPLLAAPVSPGSARTKYSAETRAEVRERVASSPPAQEWAKDNLSAGAYRQWETACVELWELCEDGGAYVEFEVESDSGGAE